MSAEPERLPPCPCGAAVDQATITRGRLGPGEPIRPDAVRLEPCGHSLTSPSPQFIAWQVARLPHRPSRSTVTLIEPLSPPKYGNEHVETPLPCVHVYEECPAVGRALRRDGEVLRSRAPVDAFLNPPAARPCGWCLRRWNA